MSDAAQRVSSHRNQTNNVLARSYRRRQRRTACMGAVCRERSFDPAAGEADNARAAGCDAYIPKPYSPRQLLAKVREYLPSPVPTR